MTRPIGWDVLGYDSDPVPGDPSSIRDLGRNWRNAGTAITDAATYTKTAAAVADDNGSWQGRAGDAFRGDMGDLNSAMSGAGTWFASASAALDTWSTALEYAQATADQALRQATEAKRILDDAQAAYDRAYSAWTVMQHQLPMTVEDQLSQQRSMNQANDYMTTARSDMSIANDVINKQKWLAQGAKSDYDLAAKTAVKALNEIADKIGAARAIPGVGATSASVSDSQQVGVWKVYTGGTSNEWGSVGGQLSYGAGANMHGDADLQVGPDGLSATAGGTLFAGAMLGASGAATFDHWGVKATAKGDLTDYAGAVATGRATANVGKDGMTAEATGTAAVEAKAAAHGSIEAAGATLTGAAVAQAGAAAAANGALAVGPTGVSAKAGASAYAGVRAGVEGGVENKEGKASVGVGVREGVGVDASAGVVAQANDVGVTLKVGAALGTGADVNIDLHLHPVDMVNDASKAIDGANHTIDNAAGAAGHGINNAEHAAAHTIDNAEHAATHAIDSAADAAGHAVNNAEHAAAHTIDGAAHAADQAVNNAEHAATHVIGNAANTAARVFHELGPW